MKFKLEVINTLNIPYVCMIRLPSIIYIVVFSVSNPMLFSALHLKISPFLASVIVIVETFPLVGSGDPLRSHLIVIGGVPLIILQSIMTSNPLYTYTGVPILTLLLPLVLTAGLGKNDPSSISGGSDKIKYCNHVI